MSLEISPVNLMDSFNYECQKQLRLKEDLERDSFECVDDPAQLYEKIGQCLELRCLCQSFTPRLLVKMFAEGTESLEHTFFLVPLWQIVRYGYVIPEPGKYFTTRYVVGVRKVSEKGFVPSLRLPLQ